MTSNFTQGDFTQGDITQPHDMSDAEFDRRFPPGHPLPTAIQRTLSNIFTFWSLCDIAKCQRAGRCAGDPRQCLDTFLPLISDSVYDEGQRVFAAKTEGLSFDELLARWPEGLLSLWRWNLAVTRCRGALSPRVLSSLNSQDGGAASWRPTSSCAPPPPPSVPRARGRPAATSRNAAPARG